MPTMTQTALSNWSPRAFGPVPSLTPSTGVVPDEPTRSPARFTRSVLFSYHDAREEAHNQAEGLADAEVGRATDKETDEKERQQEV